MRLLAFLPAKVLQRSFDHEAVSRAAVPAGNPLNDVARDVALGILRRDATHVVRTGFARTESEDIHLPVRVKHDAVRHEPLKEEAGRALFVLVLERARDIDNRSGLRLDVCDHAGLVEREAQDAGRFF